jgi:type IV pilus assembly protein PilM
MSISTVWSIDVGKSSLKAVKINRDQASFEILAVDKIDFEGGEAGIDSINQAKAALHTFATRNTIDCPVAVLHPSRSAFSRFIQLPPFDAKKLDEMIGFEAQQQIPFPIDEVIWDYHVAEGGEDAGETNVGIFAVRREDISDFMLDYEQFPLETISIGYIGLLNYVLFDLRPTRPVVVLDLGSDHTDLLIVDGTNFWFRSLPSAGKDFTQALQEKFKLDFTQAEDLKVEGAKGEHAPKIFQVVQPLIRDLVHEINRSIGFYKSQAGDVKFEDLFLFGNGSRLLGLRKSLEEQLKFRVHVGKGFNRIRTSRETNVTLLQSQFPAFASCVGAGIQALGVGQCDVNLLPQEQQEALEFKKKQKTVLIAAACLYILIGWYWVSYGGKITSAQSALQKTTVVKELDRSNKDIKSIVEDDIPALVSTGSELLEPIQSRKAPGEAWRVAQSVFSAFDNSARVEPASIPENEVSSRLGEIEAEMELLNESKWWFTGMEVRQVAVNPTTLTIADPRKDEDAVPTFLVTVAGARYKLESAAEEAAQVESRIKQRALAALRGIYGEDRYSDSSVQISLEPEIPTIHTSMGSKGPRRNRKVGDTDQSQGTLFQFTVSWMQPLPEVADAGDEEE